MLSSGLTVAIGRHDTEEAAKVLRELLVNDDFRARLDVVQGLREMTHSSAVPALLLALTDDHLRVRELALWTLQAVALPQLRDGLTAALRDGSPRVVGQAIMRCAFYADTSMEKEVLSIDPSTVLPDGKRLLDDAAAVLRRKASLSSSAH